MDAGTAARLGRGDIAGTVVVEGVAYDLTSYEAGWLVLEVERGADGELHLKKGISGARFREELGAAREYRKANG
jgi:hypothetical protein